MSLQYARMYEIWLDKLEVKFTSVLLVLENTLFTFAVMYRVVCDVDCVSIDMDVDVDVDVDV